MWSSSGGWSGRGASTIPRGLAEPPFDLDAESCLDDLEVREAIIGRGLVLTEVEENDLLLHAVDAGHVRTLGLFPGAAEAWKAIDIVDDKAAGRVPTAKLTLER